MRKERLQVHKDLQATDKGRAEHLKQPIWGGDDSRVLNKLRASIVSISQELAVINQTLIELLEESDNE